jgi:cell division protein FtsL
MAAPQRRYRTSVTTGSVSPPLEARRQPGEAVRKKAAGLRRRRFAVLVVVPVLLMLGSVYLHTVSAGLAGRVAGLEERLARAEAEGQKLELRVAELSGAERIRSLAAEELGMKEPDGADLEVYNKDGEDGATSGGEEKGGKPR